MTARVIVEGAPRHLDAFHEHHLLRIGLEALTNALKHSGARQIDVMLHFDPEHVELTVKDDGCGIAHAADNVPAGPLRPPRDPRARGQARRRSAAAARRRGHAIDGESSHTETFGIPLGGRSTRGVMADKLKLMLVDDHYLVRMGLASIMALEPDVVVCAEASSGQEARALYRIHRPDVTLMDLRLPDISGTETLQAFGASSRTHASSSSRRMCATRRSTAPCRRAPWPCW